MAYTKVPRKKKKKIPAGPYCYVATSEWKMFEDGEYGFEIKSCPFYESRPDDGVYEGHCRLIKSEITDQVKSCGVKSTHLK